MVHKMIDVGDFDNAIVSSVASISDSFSLRALSRASMSITLAFSALSIWTISTMHSNAQKLGTG